MLQIVVSIQSLVAAVIGSDRGSRPGHRPDAVCGDQGQTTAEYALVLLGAAAIASLLITWASGTDAVGKLMDFVLAQVIGSVR